MAFNRNPPTEGEIEALFDTPIPAQPQTFHLSLVLGGTVSAGAYTAGVVDFLIEALDAWSEARDGGNAPKHNVLLQAIVGTSGGGVNAAITARALAYKYPAVTRATQVGDALTGNPFYDVWIKLLTLDGFLKTNDVQGGVVSLLNGQPIDDGAAHVASFVSTTPVSRSYVAHPLAVIVTLTNLRGVPYQLDFGGGLTETFIDHADYVRFALAYPGRAPFDPRPDELVLGFDDQRSAQATNWDEFSAFARATSAFPIGFPARDLVRPTEHYRYRVAVLPSDGQGAAQIVALQPDWDALVEGGDVPADYHFVSVDGGATDNEPIELGRTILSGVTGRNPRAGDVADRAVLLVDPFAGVAGLGPTTRPPLVDGVGSTVNAVLDQTRYDTRDLLLAARPDVFSRFMITPMRDSKVGGDAIAANGLGAFIGFACPEFMRHDYLLGRQNCQAYLKTQLNLADTNPLFTNWTADQRAQYAVVSDGVNCLPIIPLVGAAAVPETPDPWPKHQLDPDLYRDGIEARFAAILEAEGKGSVVTSVLTWLGANVAEGKVADFVIDKMKESLAQTGLA